MMPGTGGQRRRGSRASTTGVDMNGTSGPHGSAHRRGRLVGRKNPIDIGRSDINVTPLVDVMLVLLIVFMLATLTAGRGHDVSLPTAARPTLEKDRMQPVVSIDIDGNLWV